MGSICREVGSAIIASFFVHMPWKDRNGKEAAAAQRAQDNERQISMPSQCK